MHDLRAEKENHLGRTASELENLYSEKIFAAN